MPAAQAEAQARAMAAALDAARDDLATKADLREFQTEVRGRFTLIQWMVGVMLTGVIALVMKAFFP